METNLENLDSTNEELEIVDSSNDTEDVELEVLDDDTSTEETDERREYTEYEKQLYARNKALEKKLKSAEQQADKATTQANLSGLNQEDILFLAKADISKDDTKDVTTWAKNNKMSVEDAYNQFKPVLDARAEERRTAEATATKSPRGIAKTTGEDLLKKAEETGIMPKESDIDALVQARLERKKNRNR